MVLRKALLFNHVHDDDIKQFRVVFDVGTTALGEQLRGDESVTLTLANENMSDGATSSLDRSDLGCDPVESGEPGFKVTETAACEVDGSLTDASFTFLVEGSINPGSRERESLLGTYAYEIKLGGGLADDENYWGYGVRI